MDKLKKPLKYILAFALPFAAAAICFGLVWFQYLQEVPQKSESYYLNDNYDSLTSPLNDGSLFTQDFTAHTTMYGIGLNFNVVDLSLDGELKIKLVDKDSGRVLLDRSTNFAPIVQMGYTCFTLDTPVTESGIRNYRLTVGVDYHTPEVTSGQMLSLRKSSRRVDGFGRFTENGNSASGSLAVMVVKDMLGDAPVKYFRIAGLFAAVSAGLIMLVLTAFPKKKAVAVFLTVFTVCSMYHMAMPVFSAPDEGTHYNTAYALSDDWFGIEYDKNDGMLPKRRTDGDKMLTDYYTSAFTYRHIVESFSDGPLTDYDKELTDVHSPRLPGFMMPYYRPAAAISFARIAGMDGVSTALLARFANLLIFAVAVTLAWCITPVAKNGLLAVALLPMSIHIGTSLSYDSFILSCSILLTALAMNCALGEEKLTRKKLAALTALSVVIAPAKVIYGAVSLLVFCIPNSKFKDNKTAWAYKLGTVAAAGAGIVFANLFRLKDTITSLFVVASARGVETIAETPVPLAETATYTIGYILTYPGLAVKLAINTLFTKFSYYFGTIFGISLGYLNLADVKINPMIISAFVLLMLLAFIPHKDHKLPNLFQRLTALFIFLVILAATVSLCLMWTPIDYDFIWGFQGRYLLPALPCFMLALQSKAFTLNKDITSVILYALFSLNLMTVLNIFIAVFAR